MIRKIGLKKSMAGGGGCAISTPSLCLILAQGWTTDKDQRSILRGFEFQESVFLGVLITAAVLFGLSNKSCILKCFIFSTIIFGSSFIHQVL